MQHWLRSTCRLGWLAAGLQLSGTAAALAENRIALVVGNDSYAHLPADSQLQKAVNDANAVGDVLARLGFEVLRGSNLDRQGMIDKLAELTGRLRPDDTAAFFYAGHGVALGGVNYLVPSDVPSISASAEARVRGASIAEADVIDEIQAKSPRVLLVVLDACRNNPFPRSGTRSAGNAGGLVGTRPARGVFTIYSAGIGQTALDALEPNDPNRNSVFTRVFVDLLAKPGLDLGGLAIGVRERVADLALNARNESGQVEPHEQNPAYYDQTLGRIYLAGQLAGADRLAGAGLPQQQRKPDAAAPPAAAAAPLTTAIAFSVSGMVAERPVDVGTVVKPGDVLARLDPRDYEAQLLQLQAQVQAAQAAEAQATLQQAKSRKLLADRRVTPQPYDAANAVRQRAQGELATLQGLLENAKYALSAAQLRAELDGTVTAVGVDVGQTVMAGQMVVKITRRANPAPDRPGTAK